MKYSRPLLLLCLLSFTSSVQGMIRILKYRPLTEVTADSICVYAQHEKNFKKENTNHPQNNPTPIVCRLSIGGEALPKNGSVASSKVFSESTLQRYEFDKLTKACVSFKKDLPPNFAIKNFAGISTECSTLEAAQRVFPDYKPNESKKKLRT